MKINLTEENNAQVVNITKGTTQVNLDNAIAAAREARDTAETHKDSALSSASSATSSASTATAQATVATTKASEASSSATSASISATTATTKASEASTSATNASTSETNASTSETNAATYMNNALDYATDASLSETNAAGSATSASASATSASTSATNASTSETNSATSATSAADSAITATTQASNASISASNAATSESNAGVSETNAGTSETNAATSATNAGVSETSASESATSASGSATSAAGSASTATTQAGIATTQAGIATTAATNASASESNAGISETNASTSETNAATSEANAATSALASSNSANAASLSANNALASENSASISANNASTSEVNAGISEANASTSEVNALSYKGAAEAARDSALAALDSFDDRYLGVKSSDPTVDNDGNPLVGGALYYFDDGNPSTEKVMKVYEGSTWVAAYASLSGALLQSSNLSDLTSVGMARTNLGLGTAATTNSTAYEPADATILKGADIGSTVQGYDANIVSDASYNHITVTSSSVSDGTNTFNKYTLPSDVVQDASYVHTDNNYTTTEKTKLSNIEDNANNYTLPSDVVQDASYVHTDNNYTTTEKSKLAGIESGATGDQTASEILTSIKTVDGSGSGLDADTVDGYHRQELMPYQSSNDFANGTLVTTNINSGVSSGDSFVIEVSGKAYGSSRPHKIIAEGYIYNNTIIKTNGTNIGGSNFTYLKVMNIDGNLSFWWPRHGYWNSYDVYVRSSSDGTNNGNRVTSISNSGDPSSATKKIQIDLVASWTSANDGSGSGLDADTVDGLHASSFLADSGKSFSTNGYQKLSNGLIIQWGVTPARNEYAGITISFPIAFPNASFTVSGVKGDLVPYTGYGVAVYNVTSTSFYYHPGSGGGGRYRRLRWIAVGY